MTDVKRHWAYELVDMDNRPVINAPAPGVEVVPVSDYKALADRLAEAEQERAEAVRRYEAAEARGNDLAVRLAEVERENQQLKKDIRTTALAGQDSANHYRQQLTEAQATVTRLTAELEEYRSIAEKIGAEKAVSELEQERARGARLRMLIYRLLNDLPTKRDWLDPELEQALRETGEPAAK